MIQDFNTENVEKKKGLNLKNQFYRLVRLWPYILLSLIICMGVALVYVRYAQPIYQAAASIMVKDEKKGGDLQYNAALESLGFGPNAKLVENEIEVLKSYDLLQAVVDSLQLYLELKNIGRVKNYLAFGDELPFTVDIENPKGILQKNLWYVVDTTDGIFLKKEKKEPAVLFSYGKWYIKDKIKFRFRKNDQFDLSKIDSTHKEYQIEAIPIDEAVASFSKKLVIESANRVGTVINLSIKDPNKVRAVAILQKLISLYTDRNVKNKNQILDNTIEFLNDRLSTLANDLEKMETTVEKYKSENRVTDISSDAVQYIETSKKIDAQKAEAETQFNIVQALESYLSQNNNPRLVPTTFGLKEPSLSQLIEKYNNAIIEREKNISQSGNNNPLVKDQEAQIEELRKILLVNVANLKQAYSINLTNISAKDFEIGERIRNVPQMEKNLVQITRNKNVQQQLYSFLLQKREEAIVSRLSNIQDSVVIFNARELFQVSPRRQVILLIAIFLGCLIPVALAIVKDLFNNRIRNIAEIRQHTNIPMLGQISHTRKKRSQLVVTSTSRTVTAEEISNIRTALSYSSKGENAKVILVSSFQSGDGKSFFTSNLAASYALLNKKTILVEFDLRKPHLASSLGIENESGVTDFLSGKQNLDQLILNVDGFDDQFLFLTAGYLPPNPAELIINGRLAQLMDELRSRFDYIIIDTPPFGPVSDALLLKKFADIFLVVIRENYTSSDLFDELRHRTDLEETIPVYIVLTDVGKRSGDKISYGYNKRYFKEFSNS